eukprot:242650_1
MEREQQLFQMEQDYLNLSKALVACQHRVDKMENELDATQHELNDSNGLFQLEHDYLNLSKTLVACEHRVDKMKNELDEKQHELNEFNRLIDEQNSNKRMEEYKTETA